jgi:ABC-type branched-subunit amino acid transport system permease subunit
VRIDETAAAAFGVNAAGWRIAAFSVGNFLIGLAGAAYAMMTGFVAPTSFTFGDSLILVSIVILGGLGNPLGLLPAALIVVVLPEKLQVIQEYRFLLFAALVIVILLVRPGGLMPRRARDYFPGSTP